MRFGKDGQWPGDEYQVGYGKPPKHSRFKPGQSGNPRGKPAGAQNALTILKQALLSSILVKQNGREIKTTKLRAILTRLVNRAMQGDYASIRLLLQYGLERELKESSDERMRLVYEAVERIRGLDLDLTLSRPDQPHIPPCGEKQQETRPASASSALNQPLGYQIGYRKAPLHSRFQKGRSGNPAGRPKVPTRLRALIPQLLDEEVSFSENGQKRTVSRRHVIFTQIVNKAALGDIRFQALLMQHTSTTNLTLRPSHGPPKNAD